MSETVNTYIDSNDNEKYEHYRFIISKEQGPVRIDKYISSKIKFATRNKVQNAIKNNSVLVNDKTVKPHYNIKPEDIITIYFSNPPKKEDNLIKAQDLNLDIVYEDDHILIINKPSGMLSHPSLNIFENTLLNGLIFHFNQISKNIESGSIYKLLEKPGLVHRLDKYTSGLMIIAKTKESLKSLTEQFFYHAIKRKYIAIVYGNIKESEGIINAPIDNDPSINRVKISKTGKRAVTHFKVLDRSKNFSLIECELETGRTHQIRVHLEYLGFPLVGESIYIKSKNYNFEISEKLRSFREGQFLHSYYMKFAHPISKIEMEFKSDLPADFIKVLNYIQ